MGCADQILTGREGANTEPTEHWLVIRSGRLGQGGKIAMSAKHSALSSWHRPFWVWVRILMTKIRRHS